MATFEAQKVFVSVIYYRETVEIAELIGSIHCWINIRQCKCQQELHGIGRSREPTAARLAFSSCKHELTHGRSRESYLCNFESREPALLLFREKELKEPKYLSLIGRLSEPREPRAIPDWLALRAERAKGDP